MSTRQVRVAILNVGDVADDEDRLTDVLKLVHDSLSAGPFQEIDYHVSPSEQALLRARLRVWSELQSNQSADLILTFGGVGMAIRERMPEATAEVVDRHLPGLPELIRLACVRAHPWVAFLRLEAGVRNNTVIINLPGDPECLRLALPHVLRAAPRAIRQLQTAPDS